jgi:Lon protease-like protein
VTLPEIIPLFPLPNVVFFPRMPLPLHVFEPRYREMVRDALRGPRLIGMALLRGEWQADYAGRPPIFATGTVGQIVRIDELPDGRFNIVLRGLKTFRIREELAPTHAYREARVAWRDDVDDEITTAVRDVLVRAVHRYLALLGRPADPSTLDRDVGDAAYVNFFAQHLELDPLERQALLEETSTSARAARLVDVLEFRLEELVRAGHGITPHGRAH